MPDLQSFQAELKKLHDSYDKDEWSWVLYSFPQIFGFESLALTKDDLGTVLEKWKLSSSKLINMVEMDALKEFEGVVRTGFGIDGHQDADFVNVRGDFESNSFKKQLDEMRLKIESDHQGAISILNNL